MRKSSKSLLPQRNPIKSLANFQTNLFSQSLFDSYQSVNFISVVRLDITLKGLGKMLELKIGNAFMLEKFKTGSFKFEGVFILRNGEGEKKAS